MTLVIQNYMFAPQTFTVRVGTTVTAINKDTPPHTWTDQGGTWDSRKLSTGQTFSYTFRRAGSFAFVCTIHTFMTGKVTVT